MNELTLTKLAIVVPLLLAACAENEPPDVPDGGRSTDGATADAGPQDAGPPDDGGNGGGPRSRITVRLDTGPMTFDAVGPSGAGQIITAGFAHDIDGDGSEEVLLVSGAKLLRLSTSSLQLTDVGTIVDGAGTAHEPDSMVSGTFGGTPTVLTISGTDLRLYDTSTGEVGPPVPFVELVDSATGATEPFAPVSMAIVQLDAMGSALPLAVHSDGRLLLGDLSTGSLVFLDIERGRLCSSGAAIRPDIIAQARLPDMMGPLEEDVLLMEGRSVHAIESGLCWSDPFDLLDDTGAAIDPDVVFGADIDGDGNDALVIVEGP